MHRTDLAQFFTRWRLLKKLTFSKLSIFRWKKIKLFIVYIIVCLICKIPEMFYMYFQLYSQTFCGRQKSMWRRFIMFPNQTFHSCFLQPEMYFLLGKRANRGGDWGSNWFGEYWGSELYWRLRCCEIVHSPRLPTTDMTLIPVRSVHKSWNYIIYIIFSPPIDLRPESTDPIRATDNLEIAEI